MPRDVFVSHASEDHAQAEQVCELLEQRGLTCWIAPRDVGAGAEWDEAILDAIERCRAYLLILSDRANHSSFVKNELNRAFSSGKAIVTLRVEDVLPGRSLELYLARHHWTDAFPPPLEPRVDQLASSLTRLLNPSAEGSAETPPASAVQTPAPVRKPVTTRTAAAKVAAGGRTWIVAFGVAAVGLIAMAVPTLRHLRETPPPETRLDIVTPDSDATGAFSLSPDGRQIVFVASGDGPPRLWVRSLASTTAQPLAGSEGASSPFWSPDSRSIGFFARNALMRIDLGGGTPRTLAPAVDGQGGTWNENGVVLFAPGTESTIRRVSASGGQMSVAAKLGPNQSALRWPYFLPDGNRFLYLVRGAPEVAGIYLGTLDGSTPVRLTPSDSLGVYLPSGWMLWQSDGRLVAQRLDLARAALTGSPLTLSNEFSIISPGSLIPVSVASNGMIAYRGGTDFDERRPVWFDRSGATRGAVSGGVGVGAPRVSPDGRRVVAQRDGDLWLLDGVRATRFTFDESKGNGRALWSPDGMRIAWEDAAGINWKLASGAGASEQLAASVQNARALNSWSPDGRFLLYHVIDDETGADLWLLPVTGNRTPSVFLKTRFNERGGVFSRDGRWVAYHSDESGRYEVYIRPFIPPGPADATSDSGAGKWQVSTAGGVFPVWRTDGKELYYLNPAGAMMAVPIAVTGTMPESGAPVELFPTRISGGGAGSILGRQYDVARDGRFLINTLPNDATSSSITLIQSWNPEGQ